MANDDSIYLNLAFGSNSYVTNCSNLLQLYTFSRIHVMTIKIVDVMRPKGCKVRKETLPAVPKDNARDGSIEDIKCATNRFGDRSAEQGCVGLGRDLRAIR